MKLHNIKKEWEEYLAIVDPWIVDIILATLVGNAIIPRDSIWMTIVAKSSGGKTTLVRPADGVPGVFFLDDLTEKTFLSGFKPKGGKETSLLKQIGNGVLAFSDFTTILSKNPVSKGEILAQMRVIADGQMKKQTGTGGLPWSGKIGFLGACTPSIYLELERSKSMGERFTYYWMNQPTDDEIADKQRAVKLSAVQLQNRMAPMYLNYCQDVKRWTQENGIPEFKMTDEQFKTLKQTSIFCVNAKATVHTNFTTKKVDKVPDVSGIGRDNANFTALLHTLQTMDCYENNDIDYPISDDRIKLIQKCAYSAVARERRKVLQILADAKEPMDTSAIGADKRLGFDKLSVEPLLDPLLAIGIVKKQGSNRFKWSIRDKSTVDFIKEVSSLVLDDTYEAPDEEEVEIPSEFDDIVEAWG